MDKYIMQKLASSLDTTPFEWLKGRSYSDSFVICIGAGPWKFTRRRVIQGMALKKLCSRDISEIFRTINWYPLEWQNNFLDSMRKYLINNKITMEKFCSSLNKNEARNKIFSAAGCPHGSKVLSLFCRDVLKVDAFPIDRHVKRFLEEHNLPANEQSMIKICHNAGLDPCEVAVGIVRKASNMDNPDWSE